LWNPVKELKVGLEESMKLNSDGLPAVESGEGIESQLLFR